MASLSPSTSAIRISNVSASRRTKLADRNVRATRRRHPGTRVAMKFFGAVSGPRVGREIRGTRLPFFRSWEFPARQPRVRCPSARFRSRAASRAPKPRDSARIKTSSIQATHKWLFGLLRAVPDGGLQLRAMEPGPSIAELFAHIHYVRLLFVSEDAPECARLVPDNEWSAEPDSDRMAQLLNESASAVRDAVKSQNCIGPGNEHALRPSDSYAPANDLARGLSSWPNQIGAQDGRPRNKR